MTKGLRGLQLRSARDDTMVAVESKREPLVIVVVHSETCAECRDYITRLWSDRANVFDWGGRLLVAVREPSPATREFAGAEFTVVLDPEQRLPISGTGVLVADEWGEVFQSTSGQHSFLSPGALAEWLRYIAIQCPECEQPEGAWREIQRH